MRKMDVSIVIPCYNCAQTIKETLESIEQSTDYSFEVLVINDGSTDNSKEAIEDYALRSSMSIRIIDQSNSGVSVARNRGIEESQGEYILFLDGDDLFADGYIEAVCSLMDKYKTDTMSCYRTRNIGELTPIREIEGHYSIVKAQELLEEYTYSKAKFGFTSFVYRKSILEKFNIRFVQGVKYGEDWEFATKYLSHCNNAIELYYYYYYRILDNSVSRTTNYRQVDAILAADRTAKCLEETQHPFASRFREYMYNRSIFSVAHRFAKGNRLDYFNKLMNEYPVKDAMKNISRDRNADRKTKVAAKAFLISPMLFYQIARR